MSQPKWISAPEGLSGAALNVWKFYAAALRADGYLTPEKAEKFAALCRLIALARAAAGEIERDGVTIEARPGVRKSNPAATVLLQAQKAMEPLLDEFGLK